MSWSADAVLAYCCASLRRVGVYSPEMAKLECMLVPGLTCWQAMDTILSKLEPYCNFYDGNR